MKKLIPLSQQLLAVFLSFALLFSSAAPAMAKNRAGSRQYTPNVQRQNLPQVPSGKPSYQRNTDEPQYFRDFPDEQSALNTILAQEELSPLEREWVELRLKQIDLDLKRVDGKITPQEQEREDKPIREQMEILEQQEALQNIYQEGFEVEIGAAVDAMHWYGKNKAFKRRIVKDQRRAMEQAAPSDATSRVTTRRPERLDNPNRNFLTDDVHSTPDILFTALQSGTSSVEEIIELLDPMNPEDLNFEDLVAATGMFNGMFVGFNNPTDSGTQLSSEEARNLTWLAERLRTRVIYQVNELNSGGRPMEIAMQAHLLLLLAQLDTFLKTHRPPVRAITQNDPLAYARALVPEHLKAGANNYKRAEATVRKMNATALATKLGSRIDKNPTVKYTDAAVSAVVTLAVMTDSNALWSILKAINKDGETLKGSHGPLVSEFFGAIVDTLLALPTTPQAQQTIQKLLQVAAQQHDGYSEQKENAINVRVDALGAASMLRQIGDTGRLMGPAKQNAQIQSRYIDRNLFTNENFRSYMAANAADVYAPTVSWNQPSGESIKKYGLNSQNGELGSFSDSMATLFTTFLPLPEPDIQWTKQGPQNRIAHACYDGCYFFDVNTWKNRGRRDRLLQEKNMLPVRSASELYGKCDRERGLGTDVGGTVVGGPKWPCSDMEDLWGGNSARIVYGTEKLIGLTRVNPKFQMTQLDMGVFIVEQALEWYVYGKVLNAFVRLCRIGYLAFKAVKATVKFKAGMAMARLESKFATATEFLTKSSKWREAKGIVDLVEEGNLIKVTLKNGEALTFHAPTGGLRTLRGRVQIRCMVNRGLKSKPGGAGLRGGSSSGRVNSGNSITSTRGGTGNGGNTQVNKPNPAERAKPNEGGKTDPGKTPDGKPDSGETPEPGADPGKTPDGKTNSGETPGKPAETPGRPAKTPEPAPKPEPKPKSGSTTTSPAPRAARTSAGVADDLIAKYPSLFTEADKAWLQGLDPKTLETLEETVGKITTACADCGEAVEFTKYVLNPSAFSSEAEAKLLQRFLKHDKAKEAFANFMKANANKNGAQVLDFVKGMGNAYEKYGPAMGKNYLYVTTAKLGGKSTMRFATEVTLKDLFRNGWQAFKKRLTKMWRTKSVPAKRKWLGVEEKDQLLVIRKQGKTVFVSEPVPNVKVLENTTAELADAEKMFIFKGGKRNLNVSRSFPSGTTEVSRAEFLEAQGMPADTDVLILRDGSGNLKTIPLGEKVKPGTFSGLDSSVTYKNVVAGKQLRTPGGKNPTISQIRETFGDGIVGLQIPPSANVNESYAWLKTLEEEIAPELQGQVVQQFRAQGMDVGIVEGSSRLTSAEVGSGSISMDGMQTNMHWHYEVTVRVKNTGELFTVNISIPIQGSSEFYNAVKNAPAGINLIK